MYRNMFTIKMSFLLKQVSDIDRTNNRKRSLGPLEVTLTPPPNLVVDAVVAPTSTFSGMYLIYM